MSAEIIRLHQWDAPFTSRLAAAEIAEAVPELQLMVLQLFADLGPMAGEQLEDAATQRYGWPHRKSTARTRRHELEGRALVRKVPGRTRVNRNRRQEQVYEITELGRARLDPVPEEAKTMDLNLTIKLELPEQLFAQIDRFFELAQQDIELRKPKPRSRKKAQPQTQAEPEAAEGNGSKAAETLTMTEAELAEVIRLEVEKEGGRDRVIAQLERWGVGKAGELRAEDRAAFASELQT